MFPFSEVSHHRAFTRSAVILILCAVISSGSLGRVAFVYANEKDTGPAEGKPVVVSAAITDCGAIMHGERKRKGLSIRPLVEDWTGFVVVENTGTTFLDHFRVSFSCPMAGSEAIKIKMISPPMPSWIWRLFVGDMLSMCSRDMAFTIKSNTVELRDTATDKQINVSAFYPSKPFGPQGLAPGEAILVEYTEPYTDCIEGFIRGIAERENMDIETEIVDREKNLMHMLIKNYKVAFWTFDRIIVALTFKGPGEYGSCSLDLSVDNEFCDSIPWADFEWK